MAELKPCPFCGGEAEPWQHMNGGWMIRCKKCASKTALYMLLNVAVEIWNKRAENEELEFTRKFIHGHGLEFALASAWNRRAEDGK